MYRMYNPFLYRRKQYSAFAIVLLAVLIYVIWENAVLPSPNHPTDPDEFIGNEDVSDDKD